MNYPQGSRRQVNSKRKQSKTGKTYGNRGKSLEEDINITNSFYINANKAIIHKKPTPIQIVDVHYPKRSAAVITKAYFQTRSTTDYNGIYQGRHLDFEAKETKNKTTFPLANVHEHQVEHLRAIKEHGGIAFFIIRFTVLDETYFVPASTILSFWDKQIENKRSSIPYAVIQKEGFLIPFHYQIRVDYLKVVQKLYFSDGKNGGN